MYSKLSRFNPALALLHTNIPSPLCASVPKRECSRHQVSQVTDGLSRSVRPLLQALVTRTRIELVLQP